MNEPDYILGDTPKVGKPLAFKTVEELQKKIDEYFEWCDNRAIKIWSEKTQTEMMVSSPAPYTMSGLARRLGIDRRTLVDYAHRDGYLPTIKAARERIHEDVETRLMEGKATTGAIFNLKNNFDWKDKNETDITSGGSQIGVMLHTPKKDAPALVSTSEAGSGPQEE